MWTNSEDKALRERAEAVIPGGMTWCMDGFTFTCTNGLCAVEP